MTHPIDIASNEAHDAHEAERLLKASSAPELANHVDSPLTATAARIEPLANEALAKELGFASYLALFEASTPLESEQGSNRPRTRWCLTNCRPDQWAVWNDQELIVRGTYSNRDEAMAAVKKWSLPTT